MECQYSLYYGASPNSDCLNMDLNVKVSQSESAMTAHPLTTYSPPFYDADVTPWMTSDQAFNNDVMMHWTQYGHLQTTGARGVGMSAHAYAIARRNERERNRVRHINSTFERLRKHLPVTGRKRKLSKVDTLRTAIRYIEHLQGILDETETEATRDVATTSSKDTRNKNCEVTPNKKEQTIETSSFPVPTFAQRNTRTDVTTSRANDVTSEEHEFVRRDFISCENLARISH